jgi:protein-L-isoaspartate(D-aspartate) O-methyltransferase
LPENDRDSAKFLEDSKSRLVRRFREELHLPEWLVEVFLEVRREDFVPKGYEEFCYDDHALPLMEGATLSQPSMLAIMLRELRLAPGLQVLEVGSGSGYFLALLCAAGVDATGVEILRGLADQSRENLAKGGWAAKVIAGDASRIEFDTCFDRIVFSAAIDEVPGWAFRFLKPGGFILAPFGRSNGQELIRYYPDRIERTGQYCRFVPFVSDAD